ncbi:MAG: polyprenyl synthetase family protein [Pyrinomonadaceae bacterium]
MSELENFLAECCRQTDKKLDAIVPNAEIAPKTLHAAIRWSLFAGGKRFRPALVFAAGKTFGAPENKLLNAAAAIEMIHTYSLIHDDLPAMDDDDLRRGKPTCHKKFGEATAILAGDVLQTLAFQAISEDESLSAEVRVKLISELARSSGTPSGMVAGQQLDLDAENKKISVRELETIHQNKTGALICAAARAGAIIAAAQEIELEAMTIYAARLGLLFQITDDLLDVTQTTETLGKTAGKDKRANKATYVSLYGAATAKKLARETHDEAGGALDNIKRDTKLLRELIDFILNRQF